MFSFLNCLNYSNSFKLKRVIKKLQKVYIQSFNIFRNFSLKNNVKFKKSSKLEILKKWNEIYFILKLNKFSFIIFLKCSNIFKTNGVIKKLQNVYIQSLNIFRKFSLKNIMKFKKSSKLDILKEWNEIFSKLKLNKFSFIIFLNYSNTFKIKTVIKKLPNRYIESLNIFRKFSQKI